MSNITKEMIPDLIAMQTDLENPPRTIYNEFADYSYTPLDVILELVKPVLKKHKLVLIQTVETTEQGLLCIHTQLIHVSGGIIESKLILPSAEMHKANNIQKMGSSISYGRRYAITCILGIASDQDTDAAPPQKKQSTKKPPAKQQQKQQPADDLPWGNGEPEIRREQRDKIWGISFGMFGKQNAFKELNHHMKRLNLPTKVDILTESQAEHLIEELRQMEQAEKDLGGGGY
jgi:hypothetical protein